jgi:hypothetical protein
MSEAVARQEVQRSTPVDPRYFFGQALMVKCYPIFFFFNNIKQTLLMFFFFCKRTLEIYC